MDPNFLKWIVNGVADFLAKHPEGKPVFMNNLKNNYVFVANLVADNLFLWIGTYSRIARKEVTCPLGTATVKIIEALREHFAAELQAIA